MKTYIYLHTNGTLLEKSPVVIELDPDYFASPFVKHVWHLDFEKPETLKEFVRDANRLHAENIIGQIKWWFKEKKISKDLEKELYIELDKANEV